MSGATETARAEPFLVAGKLAWGAGSYELAHPFDGRPIASMSIPDRSHVEAAVRAATEAFAPLAALPAHARAGALDELARGLEQGRERFARTITEESGKPIRWARIEVARSITNIRRAANEAGRFSGELIRLDGDAIGVGRLGLVRRFPIGPVLGITPFNFPLNLVVHKLGPALAVGAPIVLKPAPQTPRTAIMLAELLAETDLPPGSVSVLPLAVGELLEQLVADERLPVISYTGSQVGWEIKASQPKKRVLLELGGNAAAVVHSDADVQKAAASIAMGAFVQAGQTCISTQRVLVHSAIEEAFTDALRIAADGLATGDPFDEETIVGPMVSVSAAERVELWVTEAVDAGASVVAGRQREGNRVAPTVVTDVTEEMRIWREEVFGPVVAVMSYEDVDDAFRLVNDSRYGLQAGLFTSDIQLALRAHAELVVGTIMIGDSPSFRADALPYGGSKDSGVGREGIRWAMNELTDERGLVLMGA